MSDFQYPIVHVLTTSKGSYEGSVDRNAAYLVGHFGFLFFNICNVFGIALVHGYVFRTIKDNYLIRTALAACTFQIASCICSIRRYNINDEYGSNGSQFATVSTALGLIAFTFFNIVVLQMIFIRHKIALHVMVGVWIAIAIACFVVTEIFWDDYHFVFFRAFIVSSTIQQLVAYSLMLKWIKYESVKIDESIIEKKKYAERVIHICISLVVLALGLSASRCPALIYPSTGLSFTIMVVMASLVGEAESELVGPQWWNCFSHCEKCAKKKDDETTTKSDTKSKPEASKDIESAGEETASQEASA